jgi:hypothetical protein
MFVQVLPPKKDDRECQAVLSSFATKPSSQERYTKNYEQE